MGKLYVARLKLAYDYLLLPKITHFYPRRAKIVVSSSHRPIVFFIETMRPWDYETIKYLSTIQAPAQQKKSGRIIILPDTSNLRQIRVR